MRCAGGFALLPRDGRGEHPCLQRHHRRGNFQATFNRKVPSRFYSAITLPHLLHIVPLWEWFTVTEKLKLRSAYCKYLKFLLHMPLHERNSSLLNRYNIHDPLDMIPEVEVSAKSKSLRKLASFLPLHVLYVCDF